MSRKILLRDAELKCSEAMIMQEKAQKALNSGLDVAHWNAYINYKTRHYMYYSEYYALMAMAEATMMWR